MRLRSLGWLLCLVVTGLCLFVPEVRAQGDPVENATEQDKAQARQQYLVGKQAFAQRKFEEALQGFKGSYDVVASPNSHLMVVNTLVEMERYDEAYVEAQAVAAEAEAAVAAGHAKYGTTAAAAKRTMEWLRPQIGLVTVQVEVAAEPGTVLTVNGKALDSSQWGQPVPVLPGPLTALLTSSGGEQRREITVQAGGTDTVVFQPPAPTTPDPEPVPEPKPDASASFNPFDQSDDQRLAAYVVGGVGATGMLLFAILGGLHLSQHGDLEDQCTDGICPPELEEDADSGRGLQTGANVTLVIGLVGLAGGAALFFTTDWFLGGDDEGSAEEQAWRPTVTVGPGSVGIRGTF